MFLFPPSPLFYFLSLFLHSSFPLPHPSFSPGSRISVQELCAGDSKTTATLAILHSVSPGDAPCIYHLDQSCLSASNSRSSKFVFFLSFTFLVPPKRVWNSRATVLQRHLRFRTALHWWMPSQTLTPVLGERQDRSVGLREFVLFKPPVGTEIFQRNSYQPNVKITHTCLPCSPSRRPWYSQFHHIPGEVGGNLCHLAVLAEEHPARAVADPMMTPWAHTQECQQAEQEQSHAHCSIRLLSSCICREQSPHSAPKRSALKAGRVTWPKDFFFWSLWKINQIPLCLCAPLSFSIGVLTPWPKEDNKRNLVHVWNSLHYFTVHVSLLIKTLFSTEWHFSKKDTTYGVKQH